jgi:hypothetical protein
MKKKKNDLEKKGLKGRIKYIEEQNYFLSEGTDLMEDVKLSTYELTSYNEEENIIKSFWNSEGAYSNYIYIYDPTGKILNEEHLYFDDGILSEKYIFRYNSSGQIIEKNNYDSDGDFLSRDNYEYNSNENLVIKYYENNSGRSLSSISKYDSNGDEIEYKYYDSEEELWGKVICKYDSKGDKLEQNSYNSDGCLNHKEEFKYDSNRNMIEHMYYDSETKLNFRNFFEYELDNNNNWIAQFIIHGRKRITFAKRKIVYYGDEDENDYPDWDSPSYKGIEVQ